MPRGGTAAESSTGRASGRVSKAYGPKRRSNGENRRIPIPKDSEGLLTKQRSKKIRRTRRSELQSGSSFGLKIPHIFLTSFWLHQPTADILISLMRVWCESTITWQSLPLQETAPEVLGPVGQGVPNLDTFIKRHKGDILTCWKPALDSENIRGCHCKDVVDADATWCHHGCGFCNCL